MTAPTAAIEADRMLKDKHRAMWALGDYPALAADIIPGLGQILVTACGVRAGDQVLDVAAGSGNAAIPAVRAGARVVASDLTPELLAAGNDRPRSRALSWSGGRPMPRRYRSTMTSSASSCPAWGSCSRRITRPVPVNWSGYAARAGP